MSSITEFLDGPDSALLIANDGEVELVTTHHETATRTVIDRFMLGPIANVNAVLALLDIVNALPTTPPVSVAVAAAPQPILAAPNDTPQAEEQPEAPGVACPECSARFKNASGLTSHQRAKHGVPVAPVSVYTGDVACPQCERMFKSQHALDGHQARAHSAQAHWSTKPKSAIPKATGSDSFTKWAPGSQYAPVLPAPVKNDKAAAPVADGICPVCHAPLVAHEECDICSVLIGTGHGTVQSIFMTGLNLCHDCARSRIAARKADLKTPELVTAAL